MIISNGIAAGEKPKVAALYWDAFGAKLGRVMGPKATALAFIETVLDGSHAICAHDDAGHLVGVAGFKTSKGALVGGTFRDMAHAYGIWGATWRVGFLSLLERDAENARFLMDGIFVAPSARGQGVSTLLLGAIKAEAKSRGYAQVRLDVIDTNPRARALYERDGFIAIGTQKLGPLQFVFGFKSATTMVFTL